MKNYLPIATLLLALTASQAHADALISGAMKLLPAQQRAGIDEYMSIIGTDVRASANVGIGQFNSNFLQAHPCFEALSARLYSAILGADAHRLPNRATLKDTAASVGLKPGWLWEKALLHAGGDKLLAIHMVGICGQDDSVLPHWAHLPLSDADRALLENGLYLDMKNASCPYAASAMYFPQALGANVDISTALKEKVARIQAPSMGAAVIPAKAYHVMGEAFTACALVSHGVPSFLSTTLVKGAVNGYRATRLCEKLRLGSRTVPLKSLSQAQVKEDLQKYRSNRLACPDSIQMQIDPSAPSYCYVGRLLWDAIVPDSAANEVAEKKILREISELDVTETFRNSPYFATAAKCEGTQFTPAVRNFLEAYASNPKNGGPVTPCPADMTPDRCESMRKVIDTYLVDFEWTEAQHLAGLEFAQANCTQPETDEQLEAHACAQMKKPWPELDPESFPVVRQPSPIQPDTDCPACGAGSKNSEKAN